MKRRHLSIKAEINLVPFIDVVLVLLIVFMITIPVISQGVKVELPKITSQPVKQQSDNNWILTLTKSGKLYLDRGGRKSGNHTISLEGVTGLVRLEQQKNRKVLLFLRADKSVSYGKVIAVLGGLQKEGLTNVGLVTEPE